ncbi:MULTISPECIES: hypothetical protein [Bradyrhizobium]|uniref:hypothetical protein n=1 Tax=Bradyrhizobium TaxID=374 RepID=UPI00101F9F0D|nr:MULTISPECIES: hypothetical protein [Bradyrhizobium]MCW2117201.1 hypothetical protein [Bradyrhizobium elkanii]MCW2203647.1 hypothetical protein [Bradyrhizobium elkanii]MCW2233960.1 hypothetical protein [Bradyrhizobium elkanii]NLS70301.1 hypothetical protein [Bradyrhizobium brasilense]NWL39904.1 hypothetical protein [Bradyrhizobium elkanii]
MPEAAGHRHIVYVHQVSYDSLTRPEADRLIVDHNAAGRLRDAIAPDGARRGIVKLPHTIVVADALLALDWAGINFGIITNTEAGEQRLSASLGPSPVVNDRASATVF